jgi:hypothetical protein
MELHPFGTMLCNRSRALLSSVVVAETTRPDEKGGAGRRISVVVLLVLACVLAPLAGTSIWLKNQVTNTDRYVRTVKPLASNPAIQSAIADDVTKALFSRVDVQAEAQQALPPRAKFLAAPLANALRTFTTRAAKRFLASPRFEALWVNVQRRAHQRLVHVLTGEGKGLQTEGGKVVVDLSPIVAEVKQRLAARGLTNFKRVSHGAVGTSFTLIESKHLEQAQNGVKLLKGAAIALPLIVLALLAAAIGLSRRRRRTLLQASLGIAFSMAVLGIGLILGRSIYLSYVVGSNFPHDAASAFYDTLVHYLRLGLRAIAAVALLVAAGAFLTGPSRAAVAVRGWFGSGVGWFQGETGVGATQMGRWVGRNKRPLRIGAILLPVIIFMLWSTPTVTVLVVLVVLALLALLAIELVGRAPSPPAGVGTPTSAG